MKSENIPIRPDGTSDQLALNTNSTEENSVENIEKVVEIEEHVEGYRLIFCHVGDATRNSLNPCSKLPGQIRREQFISICADICDFDELKTGKRREGMYSAVNGFVYKFALSITAILSSSILVWAGIKGEIESLPMEIITKLRVMYVIIPLIGFTLGILAMVKYPLTKKKVTEIQKQLEDRRGVVKISE